MPKPRRKKPAFEFRPMRFVALGLAALAFGLGIGMIGTKVLRKDAAKEAPTAEGTPIRHEPKVVSKPPAVATVPRVQAVEPARGPLPAWQRFAVAAPLPDARPWIAIVIDDVGVDRKRALRAIDLPGPLTIALMTYAEDLPNLAEKARTRGHELMLHVPMEPVDKAENPGPNALLVGHDAAEMRKRLVWAFDRFDGYVGINNHMGSKFTAAEPAMRIVLAEVKSRGLLFLDSRTSSLSVATKIAGSMDVPHTSRDMFIDVDDRLESIRGQLEQVEKLARKQGYAIAIGHPHDHTMTALEAWLPKLEARGVVLVPISAIVRRQLAG